MKIRDEVKLELVRALCGGGGTRRNPKSKLFKTFVVHTCHACGSRVTKRDKIGCIDRARTM